MSCAGCDDCQFEEAAVIPSNVHEIHVTVECPTQDRVDLFFRLCEERKIKAIMIDNMSARGNVISTDVMTSHKYVGTELDALQTVVRLVRLAKQNGFPVIRTKIETSPTNPIWQEQEGYWETHMAVSAAQSSKVYELVQSIQGLYVSRNAKKPDGPLLLTVRSHGTTADQFRSMADAYKRYMNHNGVEVERLLIEYCWLDNNPDHDTAWMNGLTSP